jgi:hypothetical protein
VSGEPRESVVEIVRDRFETNFDRGEGCWRWKGRNRTRAGHVRFWIDKDRGLVYAHRVAWELEYGAIPEGVMICHHCDVPDCVRPSHLFLGDASANQKDAARKGRLAVQRRPEQYAKYLEDYHKGEANGHAKLTLAQVQEIRKRYAEGGCTLRSLGVEYGVHNSAIGRIVKGQLWPVT